MEYLNTTDIAKKWGISRRGVLQHISRGNLPQAKKIGRDYIIPSDTPKPERKHTPRLPVYKE